MGSHPGFISVEPEQLIAVNIMVHSNIVFTHLQSLPRVVLTIRLHQNRRFACRQWLGACAYSSKCLCRCYEIRCATGTVIGNYTVAGNDIVSTIPFNLTRGYTPKVDVNTVEDDYGRLWSGNDLMDQDLLFTRCYNLSQVR